MKPLTQIAFRTLLPVATLAATLSSSVPAHADQLADRLDQHVRTYMATAVQPGMGAVVVRGDQVVLSSGYGLADRDAGRAMSADTPFAIGSTTKGMTALAVMQLVEQGIVDLDAPVITYVPDFTMADDRYTRITTRQLLSMSAGLPANNALDGNQDPDGIEHQIAKLAEVKLHRDPGSGYEYANDGFNLAGLLVQRVSGEPYEQYLTDHLFSPLGMQHSTLDPAQATQWGLVQGYGHHRGVTVPLETPLTRGYMPTGGVMTTTNDAGRYLRALLNGGVLDGVHVLSPDSVNAMWTPTFRTGDRTAVGLGWMLEDVGGHDGWTWTGDIGTSSSVFLVLPDQQLGVAVMANYDAPVSLNQLARDLVTITQDGEATAHPTMPDLTKLPRVEPDRSAWDSYPGLYNATRDSIRIRRQGDQLTGTIAGGDILAIARGLGPDEGRTVELAPISPTDFVFVGDTTVLDGIPVSFRAGPDGRMLLMFGGAPFGVREGAAQ
jgi:CubicO group peptidase (beta-lactamase class C family)